MSTRAGGVFAAPTLELGEIVALSGPIASSRLDALIDCSPALQPAIIGRVGKSQRISAAWSSLATSVTALVAVGPGMMPSSKALFGVGAKRWKFSASDPQTFSG